MAIEFYEFISRIISEVQGSSFEMTLEADFVLYNREHMDWSARSYKLTKNYDHLLI